MKIDKLEASQNLITQFRRDLELLLAQPSDRVERVCPHCEEVSTCCNATDCTCLCSWKCNFAPQNLSSDPVRYPIEAGIIPLVYALSELRVCHPCWSCEGHLSTGNLVKIPQVWFYSRSLMYPRLLTEYLTDLSQKKTIHYQWRISIISPQSTVDATFSIAPDLNLKRQVYLDFLRKDIENIAFNLRKSVHEIARNYLKSDLFNPKP